MQPKKAVYLNPRFNQLQTYLPGVKYILHTAYATEGKYADLLHWLPSYIDTFALETFDSLIKQAPDVILFSMYLWSSTAMNHAAKHLRSQLPNAVLIAGGADIKHKTSQEYMQDHPWFDYVIYGGGEDAFVKLVDLLFEQRTTSLDLLNVPNLIYRDRAGKAVKTKHELYKGRVFTELSPWVMHADEVKIDTQRIRHVLKSQPHAAWEPDRGCPYHCSFCDWAYGLHNKVTKKKFGFEQELALFRDLDILVTVTAANVGMFPQDVDYMDFIYKNKIKHHEPSWAKNHKKQVLEIWRRQIHYTGELNALTALQSINETVLKNIDRPQIPWAEMKSILLELRQQGFNIKFQPEVIVGLPGETVETWDHMMLEFIDLYPLYHVRRFEWVVAPNSPAGDPEYQQKFKIDSRFTVSPNSLCQVLKFENEHQAVAAMLADAEQTMSVQSDFAWGTYSCDAAGMLYQLIAGGVAGVLSQKTNVPQVAKKIYNSLRPKMLARAKQDADKFNAYYASTGKMTSYVFSQGRLYNYAVYWNSLESLNDLMSFKT
jgi:putative methyltransferase